MSADGSNKTGANINLTKNIDIKSGWPTLVAARVKVNSSQRQTNNAYFSLMPGGYFCNTKFYAAESDKIHPYQTGIDINLDSVSWHDFLFVIDYDDEKNIEITSTTSYTGYRMDLYIDGTFIESCYTRGDCTKIAVELYRGWAHNGAIDDITVQRIPDISKIQQYLDDIELEDNDELIENVRLVTLEDDYSKLSYSLDCDESVAQILDNTLFIHRSNNDVPIVLTANLECNGFIKTKVFNLIVKGISALETESLKFVDISNGQAETAVTENLELPDTCGNGISIEWVSNTPDTVTITGELKRGKLDKRGSLTATYLKNGERFVKTYNFIISGIGKVVYMTDFNDAEAEGVSVDTLSGWTIGGTEDIHQEKSVNSTVEKNPMDTIKSFEESRKVLKVERFATKADRLVSNDKAMLDFGTVTKSEQTTYDFDFMFLSSGRIMIEMHDMQMTYVITQKGIGQYGKEIIPFATPLKQGFWYHGTIMQDAYLGLYEFYLDYELVQRFQENKKIKDFIRMHNIGLSEGFVVGSEKRRKKTLEYRGMPILSSSKQALSKYYVNPIENDGVLRYLYTQIK